MKWSGRDHRRGAAADRAGDGVWPWAPWKEQPQQAEAPLRLPVGLSANYGEAIKAADLSILDARTRAEAQPSWVAYDMVALALLPKARLTGSYDDYAAVDAALKRAEALSPDGAGPDQRQAGFDLLMHRLARRRKSLDRLDRYAIRAPNETIESEGMRGDIAFYRGDYAGADRHYDRGDAIARHSMDFRRGVKASYFGDFDKAAEYFTRSEHASRLPSREAVVTHELARGSVELRRGEWDKAAQHFARANRLFPAIGWSSRMSRSRSLSPAATDEAIRRLEPVAARSNAPEAMDLLSALYRSRGDGVRSRQWADRAGAIWQSRLEQFPDAAYGHALEHELAFGTPQRALDLARRDYASRPHGATAIALGWAWLATTSRTRRCARSPQCCVGLEVRRRPCRRRTGPCVARPGRRGRGGAKEGAGDQSACARSGRGADLVRPLIRWLRGILLLLALCSCPPRRISRPIPKSGSISAVPPSPPTS